MGKLEKLIKAVYIGALKAAASTAAVMLGTIIGTTTACGEVNWAMVVSMTCLARIICSSINFAKLMKLKNDKEGQL